ncbi:hypothetical protein SRB17_84160 [Streptomyces sp. RB17]|nr:hypothetical protein [Streptomyces sp. RB17]
MQSRFKGTAEIRGKGDPVYDWSRQWVLNTYGDPIYPCHDQWGRPILKVRVVRELGPACLPVDPVSRTTYRPGEPAQCDLWFSEADIPLDHG